MGCFHILALQVMLQNIYVLCEYMLSNLLGVYFISVGSYGNSVFIFIKELSNFFKVVSSFYILISNVWRFQFFCILTNTLPFWLVDMKWHLITVLISISLMTNDSEYLFMCILAIHVSSLEEMSIQILSPLLNLIVCLFIIRVLRAIYVFCIIEPCERQDLQ